MKKITFFAVAIILALGLSACGRMDNVTDTGTTDDTKATMPTIIPTIPTTEHRVPETSYHPDDDGFIDNTDGTDANDTTSNPTESHGRLRLRRK